VVRRGREEHGEARVKGGEFSGRSTLGIPSYLGLKLSELQKSGRLTSTSILWSVVLKGRTGEGVCGGLDHSSLKSLLPNVPA